MTKPMLTAAQDRALDWLPANGDWRMNPGRLAHALASLFYYSPRSVEMEGGNLGPRGGYAVRWRLTPKGVALFHPKAGEETT